jgi:hypothetical protein
MLLCPDPFHCFRFLGRYKQTPLHLAAKAGHLGSVRLLTTAGADPLLRDFFGRTPLHMASRNGHWEVVEEMLQGEKGAEVAKVKDKQGLTAGDLAVKRGVSVPMRLAEGLRIEAPPTEEPVAPPTLREWPTCLSHNAVGLCTNWDMRLKSLNPAQTSATPS